MGNAYIFDTFIVQGNCAGQLCRAIGWAIGGLHCDKLEIPIQLFDREP